MRFFCRVCNHRFGYIYEVFVNGARQQPECPKCNLPWYVEKEDEPSSSVA